MTPGSSASPFNAIRPNSFAGNSLRRRGNCDAPNGGVARNVCVYSRTPGTRWVVSLVKTLGPKILPSWDQSTLALLHSDILHGSLSSSPMANELPSRLEHVGQSALRI